MIVVDASVAVAWFASDEASSYADAALDVIAERGAIVPQIWAFETLNALVTATRTRRMTESRFLEALEEIASLPITCDPVPGEHVSADVLVRLAGVARTHRLSVYDAAYLDLARSHGPLATLDAGLAAVAKKMEVYWSPGGGASSTHLTSSR